MKKTKGISAYEVEKVLKTLEDGLQRVVSRSQEDIPGAHSMALGSAEGIIEHTIFELKYLLK